VKQPSAPEGVRSERGRLGTGDHRGEVLGYETDFFFPDQSLIVETDGLRYHRTPSQQARAIRRDQVHTAAGYRVLRFTHWQIAHEPNDVIVILRRIRCL
jgi:very-short-patch-repair endonuclease